MEYYGSWARDQLMRIHGWMPGDVDLDALSIDLYQDERWLRRLLTQFPEADADGDGEITAEEAVRWHAKRVVPLTPGAEDLEWLPDNVSHWKEVLRMRDGIDLSLQVYLPAGEGPFPGVKLLDIYPDGYEAMIAHGVLMARYRDGFASPTPMQLNTRTPGFSSRPSTRRRSRFRWSAPARPPTTTLRCTTCA